MHSRNFIFNNIFIFIVPALTLSLSSCCILRSTISWCPKSNLGEKQTNRNSIFFVTWQKIHGKTMGDKLFNGERVIGNKCSEQYLCDTKYMEWPVHIKSYTPLAPFYVPFWPFFTLAFLSISWTLSPLSEYLRGVILECYVRGAHLLSIRRYM